jgi:hypothetical protein
MPRSFNFASGAQQVVGDVQGGIPTVFYFASKINPFFK